MGTFQSRTFPAASPSFFSDEGIGLGIFMPLWAVSNRASAWVGRYISQLAALPATSLSVMNVRVPGCVFMALRAVCDCAFQFCSRILTAFRSQATARIDLCRDRLKMVKIYTSPVRASFACLAFFRLVAGMIKRQSIGDWTDKHLVGNAMCPVTAEHSISRWRERSSPFPAAVFQFADVFKKQFLRITRRWSRAAALTFARAESLCCVVGSEFCAAGGARFILFTSHSIPQQSFWSGSRGVISTVVARLYFKRNRKEST